MTKDNELDVLKRAIVELGPDSYLGPWLKAALPAIEADIRSDFSPNVILPGEANAEGTRIIEAAKRTAAQMVAQAQAETEKIKEAANNDVRDLFRRAAEALEQHAREIGRRIR